MCFLSCQERLTGRPLNFAPLDAIMLLKMWLDPGAPPQLAGLHIPPIGSQLVHSLSIISTKAHTSWLRNSFSWHAVADICCLRQQNVIFHYFHNLPLSQKLDPRLIAILSQSILMSHALKKAAVGPTDSVKHEARFNGRKNKEHLLGFF